MINDHIIKKKDVGYQSFLLPFPKIEMSAKLRIRRLHPLCRGSLHQEKECSRRDNKLYKVVRLMFWSSGEYYLIPNILRTRAV